MTVDVYEEVCRLIYDLELHPGQGPVNLDPLETIYVPVTQDLAAAGVQGYTMKAPDRRPSLWWPAFIVLDERRHRVDRRLLYCHEIGHLVCGHSGSLLNLQVDDWFHTRAEREASEVASMLLIPMEEWYSGDSAEVIACRCQVKPWVAEIYPKPWKRWL